MEKDSSIHLEKQASHEAGPNDDLVAKFSAVKEWFKLNPTVVYYPCGAYDTSPSVVFPEGHIVYVELDEQAVEALKRAGHDAHHASATEYELPAKADVLILINPSISPMEPARNLNEGGYVVCNNYHGTAEELHNSEDFEFIGLLHSESGQAPEVGTSNLQDCWETVETDEELAKTASFEYIRNIVKNVYGDAEEAIVDSYKKLLDEKDQRDDVQELGGVYMLTKGGRYAPLLPLPPKKGEVDDLFIFQKRKHESSREM